MIGQIVAKNNPTLLMANAIRFLAMDAVQQANSGHPGMPMGWQMLLLFFLKIL